MSDLIKKIKIKKQDGTFTDYIPIGAEAQNVSTSDGDSVQLKLNKKPYYYNSVADMKADTKLKVGDMAVTLGYYEPNDGGNGEYRIVSGSYTDNGGSYHQLDNNLFAELIIKNNTVNVDQFGAKGDGVTDNSSQIQNAIDNFDSIIFGNKIYLVASPLNINRSNITISGVNSFYQQKQGSNNGTCLKYSGSNSYLFNVGKTNERLHSFALNNIYLRGISSSNDSGAIKAINFSSFVFYNVTFQFWQRQAILFQDLWDSSFIACNFFNCGSDLETKYWAIQDEKQNDRTNALHFTNCRFEGNPLSIRLNDAWDCMFTNCKMEYGLSNNFSQNPIVTGSNSRGIIFTSCFFSIGHITDLYLLSIAGTANTISECCFLARESQPHKWIELRGTLNTVSDCTFDGTSNSDQGCVFLNNSVWGNCNNNRFFSTGESNPLIGITAHDNTITNNRIYQNSATDDSFKTLISINAGSRNKIELAPKTNIKQGKILPNTTINGVKGYSINQDTTLNSDFDASYVMVGADNINITINTSLRVDRIKFCSNHRTYSINGTTIYGDAIYEYCFNHWRKTWASENPSSSI